MHTAVCHWMERVTSLVECWNSLDGKTVELTSWVHGADYAQAAGNGISIEKLESQLATLKATFKEKELMLDTLKTRFGCKCNSVEVQVAVQVRPEQQLPHSGLT